LKHFKVAEVSIPLWNEVPAEEWPLEAGKVANVRRAAQSLNGVEIPAGAVFSFWAQIGRPTASRGFVVGREVRAGCVIPAVAGGLCLLSNSLYQLAIKAGLEIVERHGHTHEIFDAHAQRGDATVFWNYVDLRFRAPEALRLEVELDENSLRVSFYQESEVATAQSPFFQVHEPPGLSGVRSCFSCAVEECRNYQVPEAVHGRRAFLLDTRWPELDAWLRDNVRSDDLVIVPIDGKRRDVERYAWTVDTVEVLEIPLGFAARSLSSRIFRRQGPEMRAVQMRMDQILAMSMGRMLPVTVQELVVSQNLLVHLQEQGVLGGRSVTVLATRPPLSHIQRGLDHARSRWPKRSSLSDFRVDQELLNAEQKALDGAREIVTPNSALAAHYGSKSQHIKWTMDEAPVTFPRGKRPRPLIYFPGGTIARLGVCALKEAIEELDVDLFVEGRNLEDEGFWNEVNVLAKARLEDADLVILPAWLAHNPRSLLHAASLGIPVVTSPAMGLGGVPGVTEVPCGDPVALRSAIERGLDILPTPFAHSNQG
jgi:hypothetical protein